MRRRKRLFYRTRPGRKVSLPGGVQPRWLDIVQDDEYRSPRRGDLRKLHFPIKVEETLFLRLLSRKLRFREKTRVFQTRLLMFFWTLDKACTCHLDSSRSVTMVDLIETASTRFLTSFSYRTLADKTILLFCP